MCFYTFVIVQLMHFVTRPGQTCCISGLHGQMCVVDEAALLDLLGGHDTIRPRRRRGIYRPCKGEACNDYQNAKEIKV